MPKKVKSLKKKPNSKRPNKKTSKKAGMMSLRKLFGTKSVEDQVNELLDKLSRKTITKKDRTKFGKSLLKEEHKNNKKNPYYELKKVFLLVSIKISQLDMSDRQSKLRLLETITKRFVSPIQLSEVMAKLRKPSDILDEVNTTLEDEFGKLRIQNETIKLSAAQRNLDSRTNMSNAMTSAFLGSQRKLQLTPLLNRTTSNNFIELGVTSEGPHVYETQQSQNNIEVQSLINQAQQEIIRNLPSAPTTLPRLKGGSYKRKSRKRVYA